MAKYNPEQEAFKQRDQVNDGKADETSQRLSLEANAAQGSDKTAQKEQIESFKVADGGDASIERLGTLLSSIAEKASRLPEDMRRQLVDGNTDFINPALLAVVQNPQQFMLGDKQDPDAVKAFLARVSKG